jgi:hypothetical protein
VLPLVGIVGALTLSWVRFREELKAFLAQASEAGAAARRPPADSQ